MIQFHALAIIEGVILGKYIFKCKIISKSAKLAILTAFNTYNLSSRCRLL